MEAWWHAVSALGIWLGLTLTRRKAPVQVILPAPALEPFIADESRRGELPHHTPGNWRFSASSLPDSATAKSPASS